MKILSISPAHDSSVCLLEDGKILFYLKEERLSRSKRDHRPILSLFKILCEIDFIDYFVYCPPQPGAYDQFIEDWKHIVEKLTKVGQTIDLSLDHHKQHASLAFYNSGFTESAVIIADGSGSPHEGLLEAETIFYAQYPSKFIPVYKNYHMPDRELLKNARRPSILENFPECEAHYSSAASLTDSYTSATVLFGEHPLENGKTMGLAAYGDKRLFKNLFNENYLVNNDIWAEDGWMFFYKDLFNYRITPDQLTKKNYQIYADYSKHVQDQTEKAMIFLIQKAIDKTKSKNICISGGYGLNVVANNKYLKNFPGINFYFEPNADDGGNSVGAAMNLYRTITKDNTISKINHTFYHGFEYPLNNIGSDMSYEDVAMMLNDNKSVAIYYKLAEAGPRALGHRSILFDPRNKNAKDLVNIIKKREWYRPFAAACLEEDAKKYFDLYDNIGYEFMTINADAKDLAKVEIPGVLHVDDTCRIQIVKDESEPLYKLLKQFKKITGLGVLLNTSFNLAGEALVETPEDAINTFNNSDLYCLWFPEIHQGLIKN